LNDLKKVSHKNNTSGFSSNFVGSNKGSTRKRIGSSFGGRVDHSQDFSQNSGFFVSPKQRKMSQQKGSSAQKYAGKMYDSQSSELIRASHNS